MGTIRNWSPEPIVAMIDAWYHYAQAIFDDYPVTPTISVINFNGYKCTRVTFAGGSDPTVNYYIYNGQAFDELIPVRMLLKHPMFQPRWVGYYGDGELYADAAAVKAAFAAICVPAMTALIDAYTNGSCEAPVYYTIASAADLHVQTACIIPIVTDAEVLPLTIPLYALAALPPGEFVNIYQQGVATPGAGVPGGGDSGALAQIAQTLIDMSRSSRVTWINNQGGFADIMSGDIVTPGGGGGG